MKRLLAAIFILLCTSSPSWALVKNFTPTDALIKAASPTSNQNNINQVSGTFATNDGYLMKFDLSSIAGQTAIHAYLNIWTNRGGQHTNNIYRILRDYSTTQVTYNVYSTGNNWTTAGALGSGTDYTSTNASTYVMQSALYAQSDVTAMVNDCLLAGNTCNIEMRWNTGTFDVLDGVANSTNPPYLTVTTGTPGVPVPWYVRDDGAALGSTSTTCNGTTNVGYTTGMGPNCAVSHPNYIVGNGQTVQWTGGDIMYVDGDSHTSFAFTVSGVTTRPAIGDTYTNNGHTYTVTVTLPAGKASGTITMSGAGLAPLASGTLTRTSGSGDATIAFSAEGAAQAMYALNTTITIPQGAVGQPTSIIGTGSHKAQFYDNGAFLQIDAKAGNIDIENIDITKHDSCIASGPTGTNPNPDGYNYLCGQTHGLQIGGTSETITNVNIHNLYNGMVNGVNGGTVGDITFTNVKIFGNSMQGGIIGGFNGQSVDNVMTGTIRLISSMVDFNGCGQRYPLQDSADIDNNVAAVGFSQSVRNEANYYNCFGQGQNGYGDGWGFGATGAANAGNWTIIGSDLSFNTQDGFDSLHGAGNGTITIIRSLFEGNGGQQIKANGAIEDIEDSIVNGDCARWLTAPETSTTVGSTGGADVGFIIGGGGMCRAQGDTIVPFLHKGTQVYIYGDTINTNGIAISEGLGSAGCDSTSGIHIKNTIINGGSNAAYDPTINAFTSGNAQLSAFIYLGGSDGNGTGTCGGVGNGTGGVIVPDEDYNIVYNTKGNNSGCLGAHDICGGAGPGFIGSIPMGTPSGGASTFYHGTNMVGLVPLLSSSAARGAGNTTNVIYTNGINDFNNFTPTTVSPLIDIGALQYGSTSQSCSGIAATCTTNGGCCSGFCVSGACAAYNCGDGVVTNPEVCDGSNLNSQTCVLQGFASGSLSCNANCLTFVTSSCTGSKAANGAACSTGADCISGLCSGSLCVANICGNGIIEGSELCDGALLNSQTCFTQGFGGGGSLACAGNCLTFDTSSCSAPTGINLGFSGTIGAN